eukprot:Seg405.6 transcript_id=Seg405.6/GoldUCD/mRNA.D3Y31 product="hypothetical protein" protein_id=Seg405.6/GoldUCD/D3Y31
MKTILSLVLFALYANCKAALSLERPTKVGCYKDKGDRRALPVLVKNFRLGEIDWSDLDKIVKKCADAVRARGYTWFGVQFYGECWSGPNSWMTYNMYGPSDNCWKGVGKHWTNMVYNFEGQGRRKHLKLGRARHFKGTFFIKLKGHFLKIKRALLCLLQNLGGTRAPSAPPVPTSLHGGTHKFPRRNHISSPQQVEYIRWIDKWFQLVV